MTAVLTDTRRVEYLGLPSPHAHPDVMRALATRPRSQAERREQALIRREVTKQEQRRQMQGFARVQGRTRITLGPKHGLSREYTWGPRVWHVEMDPHDIEVLMRMHPKHREAFRVHDDVILVRSA